MCFVLISFWKLWKPLAAVHNVNRIQWETVLKSNSVVKWFSLNKWNGAVLFATSQSQKMALFVTVILIYVRQL